MDSLEYALGMFPSAPGFQFCRIEPRLGVLTFARGIVSSVRGNIKVEWHHEGAKFWMEVGLPEGLETEIHAPFASEKIAWISHDGVRLNPAALTAENNSAVVRVVGGSHRLELETLP